MADSPQVLVFDPPRSLQAVKVGEVVSCDAEGGFQHGGSISDITIGTLPGLLNFIGDVKAGRMRPVIVAGGQVLTVPLWLALDLDTAVHAGRLQVRDAPADGQSDTVTEAP